MREPMSTEFVSSFVLTCMQSGLTKEATAELLQRQSVIHACEQSPEFAEGYEKVATMAPGGLRPMARAGFLEKQAISGRGTATALKGLGSVAKGLWQQGGDIAGSVGRGLQRFAGQGRLAVKDTVTGAPLPSFVQRNPLTAFGIGAAGTGAAAYGLHRLSKGGPGGAGDQDTPFLPPGGFNPVEAQKRFDDQLAQHSTGIADVNKRIDEGAERRRVLQEAVTNHAPGSQMAKIELDKLDANTADATNVRSKYLDTLDSSGAATAAKLKAITDRQQTLEGAKTSWGRLPQRAYYKLTGRDPNEVYNKEITQLEGGASKATTDAKLIEEQRRRLNNGYIGQDTKVPTPQQNQARFFPTYE